MMRLISSIKSLIHKCYVKIDEMEKTPNKSERRVEAHTEIVCLCVHVRVFPCMSVCVHERLKQGGWQTATN